MKHKFFLACTGGILTAALVAICIPSVYTNLVDIGTEVNKGANRVVADFMESPKEKETKEAEESTADFTFSSEKETQEASEAPETESVAEETAEVEAEETAEMQTEESSTEETKETNKNRETSAPETKKQQESQEITVHEVSDVMYTTTSLKVRKGPGMDQECIGFLDAGAKVERTGYVTGWSRISYQGRDGYVGTGYLITEAVMETSVSESSTVSVKKSAKTESGKTSDGADSTWLPSGAMGCFTSSSLGINVALYYTDADGAAQKIVNQSGCAAYMMFGSQTLIAGNYQELGKITNAVPGQTTASIKTQYEIQEFICTKVGKGTNITTDLLDESGKSISTLNGNGLCIYTSNSSGRDIYYSFWQPR